MKKLGFSLIEVLLVLGIIAVVTAMGFSITQKSIERAYNQYWYTGFKALWDATSDYESSLNGGPITVAKYKDHITKLIPGNSSTNTITATNGIIYTISGNDSLGYALITMTIPEIKQSKSKLNKTQFSYYWKSSPIVLYPYYNAGSTYLKLHNRADILPFYVKGSNGSDGVFSFQEAYCRVNGYEPGIVPDCNLVTTTHLNQGGVFYPANPRKVY